MANSIVSPNPTLSLSIRFAASWCPLPVGLWTLRNPRRHFCSTSRSRHFVVSAESGTTRPQSKCSRTISPWRQRHVQRCHACSQRGIHWPGSLWTKPRRSTRSIDESSDRSVTRSAELHAVNMSIVSILRLRAPQFTSWTCLSHDQRYKTASFNGCRQTNHSSAVTSSRIFCCFSNSRSQ